MGQSFIVIFFFTFQLQVEVVKRFPLPRSRVVSNTTNGVMSPAVPQSPFDVGASSPFNPSSNNPFPGTASRRFPNQASNPAGAIGSPSLASPGGDPSAPSTNPGGVDRQTCLFSNTVPQDVLNFSNAIQVREPVRVLVRREGGGSQPGGMNTPQLGSTTGGFDGASGGPQTPGGGAGGGLKHLYLYLAFTAGSSGGARVVSDSSAPVGGGAGAIGAGRAVGAGGGGPGGAEANQAKEWKLDALADLVDDESVLPGIIYVGGESVLEAVGYKLASKGFDVVFLVRISKKKGISRLFGSLSVFHVS